MAAERGNKGCNKGENTPLSWRHLANNVKKITFLIVGVWAVNFTCQKLSKLFKVFFMRRKMDHRVYSEYCVALFRNVLTVTHYIAMYATKKLMN